MTQRFLIYPILFIVLTQLVPVLRHDQRWYAAQIAQLSVTLLACLGGLYFSDDFVWVVVAWTLFVWLVIAPALLASLSVSREQRGRWRSAAVFRQLAARVAWGQTGKLFRQYSSALRLVAGGHTEQALTMLDGLATQPMPPVINGIVHAWKLSSLVTLRQWERAVTFYESVYDWGALGQATQARLFAARALAETGQIERALRNLQVAALSPRTLGARQTQLWATRICVAALAGDTESVEELLQRREYASRSRGFARFAAYWRGRCALARGEFGDAARMLTRAFELTSPRNRLWRDAITQQLQCVEEGRSPTGPAAQTPAYAHGQELLRRAEQDTAPWRGLMSMGRPELVTLALLLILAVVYLMGDVFLPGELQDKLLLWAGNSPDTLRDHEWWRLFTALFLHANLLHLAMNGAGLWIFGSAVEKTMGHWRVLAIFLVAGVLGNLASAFHAHYDVAIGASGGIFGVIGAFVVSVWRLRSPMYFALRRRLLLVLALMVASDFTIGGLEPQVDNLAHVGGFVAGILIAILLYPSRRKKRCGEDPIPVS
jgi:membrane associated rhomboid family serine protease